METNPSSTFPVIRGLQAHREYYVAMWSLKMVKRLLTAEDDMPPELRAQRSLNRGRIPELKGYILDNPEDYIFSGLTVSIDSSVEFEPLPGQTKLGILKVPLDCQFIVNDGQHRRAAIEEALKERPELQHETIAVVLFLDIGLERCQQMFADLNRHAIRPSRSLGLLYDHRSEKAQLAKRVVLHSEFFRDAVEMEKSSLSKRSRKLFTLSAFYNACADLLEGHSTGDIDDDAKFARSFWEAVASHFPAWQQVKRSQIPAGEIRESFIHSHGIALQAIGKAGNALIHQHPNDWSSRLNPLEKIDWSRRNTKLWEGRAMTAGRVSKNTLNIGLVTNVLLTALSLPLDEEQKRVETAFNERHSVSSSKTNGRMPVRSAAVKRRRTK